MAIAEAHTSAMPPTAPPTMADTLLVPSLDLCSWLLLDPVAIAKLFDGDCDVVTVIELLREVSAGSDVGDVFVAAAFVTSVPGRLVDSAIVVVSAVGEFR